MPSRKSPKESRGRKRSKSKESSKTSRKKSISVSGLIVSEYSMKIFAPSTYSFNEDALQTRFPGVSLGVKRVIKNNNLAGYNYIFSCKNKVQFEYLMADYKKFFARK